MKIRRSVDSFRYHTHHLTAVKKKGSKMSEGGYQLHLDGWP
ncbi:hypothetical protein AVEN_230526-1, partial [Araneus ventricosus]